MSYRKIIGFGDSSFVVSLPKEWVVKNGLKKGDNVLLDGSEGNIIKISPIFVKQNGGSGGIKINFEDDIKKLKSEILYAYVNSFNPITIVGKDINNKINSINDVVKNFMYLEIVDHVSTDKIVLNTSINLDDISVYDILRRIDRTVISMVEDVKDYLSGKTIKISLGFNHKEENINKLCNLVFKILKLGFNPGNRTLLKISINDIFYYWELALFLEKTANQLKRIPRYPKPPISPELLTILDKVFAQYQDAMKSNFTKDHQLAISVFATKKSVYDKIDQLSSKLPRDATVIAHKMGMINTFSGNIAMAFLRLGMEINN